MKKKVTVKLSDDNQSELKSFVAVATVTLSVSQNVKARDLKHAKEIAESLYMPALCDRCVGDRDAETWILSGTDGEAREIKVFIE